MHTVGTVTSLARYPVKSLQGETVDTVMLHKDGVDGDRRFAFRDLETARIASAKQPRPWRALLDLAARHDTDRVVVRAPSGDEFPIEDPALCAVVTGLTGRAVEVVSASPDHLGSYDSTWPQVDGVTLSGAHEFPMANSTDAVRFVDVAALHVVTTATLAQLEQASPGSTADPRRLRPNLVIDTGDVPPGFVEDAWVGRTLRIGDTAEIRLSSKAPRCVMTTVEQPGLEHDPGILRAAATNRHDFPGIGTLACAGLYAEVATPGPVRIGDPISLR
ncbi:MAG: MOSC domain-containing protein [Nitriliruptor sp.]|nr:MAG: MOSC domain-containing protein [Nitriliruptor sp.]